MTTLTARTTDDLLAMVPVVLGFEPADSVVMLTVDAPQPFHARVDLPPGPDAVPEVVDLLLEPALRHGVRAVVLLVYSAHHDLARAVVRRARRGLAGGGAGPRVLEALRADAGRWYPLLRDRRGLGTTGVAYDVASHPFVVEAVVSGRVLHSSREQLADTLRADEVAVAAVAAARVAAAASAPWASSMLATWASRPDPPPVDVAARLLGGLAEPAVRQAAWAAVPRDGARDHVRLWSDLVRRSPEDLVAHAAALLGLCAWVAGDGALAWCAVDRCRAVEPDHVLAGLVADLLVTAVPPSEWEVVRSGLACLVRLAPAAPSTLGSGHG